MKADWGNDREELAFRTKERREERSGVLPEPKTENWLDMNESIYGLVMSLQPLLSRI